MQPGDIFDLIGSNGAGETATIDCLAGLRKPIASELTGSEFDVGLRLHILAGGCRADLARFYSHPNWNVETKSAILAVESRIVKIDVICAEYGAFP